MDDLSDIKVAIPLIIWWCEGTKPRRDKRWKNAILYPIEVTNTNSRVIKIFINYLINNLGVPANKLKGQLQIHKGDNQKKLEKYWSDETKIPISQFNKTIIREVGNKQGKGNGTFKLRFYDQKIYKVLDDSLNYYLNLISESGAAA